MAEIIDKKAFNLWNKANRSYENYQNYLIKKEKRFDLSLIDLLYISNFKGGNATINEPESLINNKLASYSKKLFYIESEYKNSSLADLDSTQIQKLINLVLEICNLTRKDEVTRIDGFSVSYLSALLNAYFPKLIPILDRRVLTNLNLISNNDVNRQGQIKNIQRFYKPLIERIAIISKETGRPIREIDQQLFVIRIERTILAKE
jgi:hypothetical protein